MCIRSQEVQETLNSSICLGLARRLGKGLIVCARVLTMLQVSTVLLEVRSRSPRPTKLILQRTLHLLVLRFPLTVWFSCLSEIRRSCLNFRNSIILFLKLSKSLIRLKSLRLTRSSQKLRSTIHSRKKVKHQTSLSSLIKMKTELSMCIKACSALCRFQKVLIKVVGLLLDLNLNPLHCIQTFGTGVERSMSWRTRFYLSLLLSNANAQWKLTTS